MGGYAPRGGGRASLPPLHGDAFQLLRWPICGSLMHGRIDGTERLNVELPSKGARVDNMEVQRLHRCLLSEAADERQFVRGLVLRVPRQTDAHQGGEQLLGEQLEDEQMRLRLPTAGQLVVNECALAVLALRVTASKVGPASAVNRALVQLALPRTDAEAFARLDDPAGPGVRAHLWQHRRPYFLVRMRAPGSVLGQLPLDLFELVLKDFIGTGYEASAYA
jgi:hypothetical protein